MSDYLAIGGVSAVLKTLLLNALSDGGPSAILGAAGGITNSALDLIPTGPDETAQVNLFMYYASINSAMRNLGLPSANAKRDGLSNPPLALNLHYLVTTYGSAPFDPEILMGWAMQVFHDTPVVPRAIIEQAFADLVSAPPAPKEQQMIAASSLVNQFEQIRITPEALTTEEIYRLWSAFQTSYRPTTSYQISVVVIQGNKKFISNLPVQTRSVTALPLMAPAIVDITPSMAVSGETLTITGSNFLGDSPSDTLVSFDGAPGINPTTLQGGVLRVALPSTLTAGVHNVRVQRQVVFPTSSRPHSGFASNPFPFQVVPTIQMPVPGSPVVVKRGDVLSLTLVPQVGRLQSVVVYLGDLAIPLATPPPAAPNLSATIAVPVPADTAVGTSPLRVEIDGVQSVLTQDKNTANPTFGQWLPQVQVTA
ncbi:DUF4255 domain-containing protein [Edaphobacter aggregans]|uniref:DUF4255 domain-containing protein n=1 Tax=Edaphobacter aggregans TaxID=570835 RepID=UPI0006905D01|nr:DUF4255 domain-containing protein [Edaphobacter aggregans]